MHLLTLAMPDGHIAQRTELTAGQQAIRTALELPQPPRYFDITIPASD